MQNLKPVFSAKPILSNILKRPAIREDAERIVFVFFPRQPNLHSDNVQSVSVLFDGETIGQIDERFNTLNYQYIISFTPLPQYVEKEESARPI